MKKQLRSIYTALLLAGSLTVVAQTPDSAHIKGLKTVTVTAQKPIIRREIDRLIYDFQADPDSKGSNVLEIMRKVPYLSVDAAGNILLKGNTSFRILVNGKPSALLEKDPSQLLRTIPASTIQQIEVITTPPSKYDGEGLSGIINIITIKRKTDGYNGTINVSERFPANGPGTGASFALKSGKLGISAFGGASKSDRPHTINDMQRHSGGESPAYLEQDGDKRSGRKSAYLGTEISYEADSLHLLAAQLNISRDNSDGKGYLLSDLSTNHTTLQHYYLNNTEDGKGNSMDAGINYQITSRKNKNNLLTFSYRYATNGKDLNYQQTFTDTINYFNPGYRQYNNETFGEHAAQIDYVRTFKKFSMEAGVKGIWRNNTSDYSYEYYQSSSGKFERDPSSDRFNGSQDVFSAYNSYTFSTKKWDVKAGVRVEQTFMSAAYQSDSAHLHKQFLNLLPSLIINRKLNNNSSLNLGISQRLKRPNIYRLNPFTDRSNPSSESSGNPALRPTSITDFQLSYSWSGKMSVNAGISYSYNNNMFMEIAAFDTTRYITRTTIQNNVKGGGLALNYSINYPLLRWLNLNINGNTVYISVKGEENETAVRLNTWINMVNTALAARLNKGWKLNASLNVIGRNQVSLQAYANAIISTSFGFNKELIKDRLSCSGTINNPFTQYRNNRITMNGILFTQDNRTQEYFRTVNMSVNYNFGKLRQGIQKNKRGIKNDDGN
ncbi:outer membrane beta-barrel protein [Chitinophaga ginsengisoli]|uniref:Outer membrane receptor protein involved in Fe transport n=1 Tax=Chitinophaga ginsengisoli TaxID=363837 RepID=A0A2P8G2T8_9BACT|nr:outer membrane beta-barrel protein [Chitinophaga ginsengisoli]PSL28279.1 outer membrane receptor protein involved in Fe transport [Chitinophaga ginsengisoli]